MTNSLPPTLSFLRPQRTETWNHMLSKGGGSRGWGQVEQSSGDGIFLFHPICIGLLPTPAWKLAPTYTIGSCLLNIIFMLRNVLGSKKCMISVKCLVFTPRQTFCLECLHSFQWKLHVMREWAEGIELWESWVQILVLNSILGQGSSIFEV